MQRGKMQRVVSRKKVVKQSENEEGKKMRGIGGNPQAMKRRERVSTRQMQRFCRNAICLLGDFDVMQIRFYEVARATIG